MGRFSLKWLLAGVACIAIAIRGLDMALRPAYWKAMSRWSGGPLVASIAAGAIAGTVVSILTNRYPPAGALIGAVAAFILCLIVAEILVDLSALH